ncbi:MAG: GNAT family N-acetyltransferase [Candidatus Methanomethylicia archaeon]
MSEIEVRELKESEYEIWDKLVEKSPHGTIFHNSDWLIAHSKLLNKKLKIYGFFRGHQMIGGCPLYMYRLKFLKVGSSNVEMTPYSGIIFTQLPETNVRKREHVYITTIRSLCDVIDKEQIDIIQIVNSPNFIDVRPFIWKGWRSKVHYTYCLDLDLEINIPKEVRWNIRKAIKNNIIIRRLNDPTIFYELFSMTFKRKNLIPAVTKDFFEYILKLLKRKKIGEMWIAEMPSGEVASAEIFVWDNKRAYRWMAASHTALRSTGATSLLIYEVFQNLKREGFKEVILMAANVPQLAEFMSSFNPKLIPYYSVEKKKFLAKTIELIREVLYEKKRIHEDI